MYLDPGFGGMLVQVIVAIVAMSGILLFSLRRKIRALFSKNKDTAGKNTDFINRADTEIDTSGNTDDVIDMLSGDNMSGESTSDD